MSQRQRQENTRKKEAWYSVGPSGWDAGGCKRPHQLTSRQEETNSIEAVVWLQKQTSGRCQGIKWAQIDDRQCGWPSGKMLPFVRSPWLWGMGPADWGPQRPTDKCSNRVLFPLGYKAYCDSRHVAMAAVGKGERDGGTDGGHQGPNSHARAPCSPLSPWGVQWGLRHLTAPCGPVQFHLRALFKCLLPVGLSLLININFHEKHLTSAWLWKTEPRKRPSIHTLKVSLFLFPNL